MKRERNRRDRSGRENSPRGEVFLSHARNFLPWAREEGRSETLFCTCVGERGCRRTKKKQREDMKKKMKKEGGAEDGFLARKRERHPQNSPRRMERRREGRKMVRRR